MNIITFNIQGERSFFLLPGEKLEHGIQDVFILGEDEGLILKTNEGFIDVDEKEVTQSVVFCLISVVCISDFHICLDKTCGIQLGVLNTNTI